MIKTKILNLLSLMIHFIANCVCDTHLHKYILFIDHIKDASNVFLFHAMIYNLPLISAFSSRDPDLLNPAKKNHERRPVRRLCN